MSNRVHRLVAWLVALPVSIGIFAGCGSGPRLRYRHEYQLAPGQEHTAELKRAVLTPIDITNEDPIKGLDVANDRIPNLVAEFLGSKGIELERVDRAGFKRAIEIARKAAATRQKNATSGTVSQQISYGAMMPDFLKALDSGAELVVLVDVTKRQGIYSGTRTISFDGVKRREKAMDLDFSNYGAIDVASLGVWIYRKDGTQVFSGFGGLDTIFRVDRASEKFVVREDLLQDDRNLREGVCIAFYPYFGLESRCIR